MTDEIQLNDVLEKKVDFFSLPKEEKERLQNDYIETIIPEEDREIARKEGFTPPEMFRGLDRYGNPVQAKTWDEFKHNYLEKREPRKEKDFWKEEREQMKREMAEMKELLRLQTSNSFQSEEERINAQIQEARSVGDFDEYDRLILKKAELTQKKSIIQPKEVKKEPTTQYTPEEQEAMVEFKFRNKDFVQDLSSDEEMLHTFDAQLRVIANSRPDLKPHQILDLAKLRTERSFDKTNKKVFMNNQYNNNSTFTPEKKETAKIVFDNLSLSDKLMVESAFRQPPYSKMSSKQEVAEALFGKYLKK